MILNRNLSYCELPSEISFKEEVISCIDNKNSSGSQCLRATQMAPLLFHDLNDTDNKGWEQKPQLHPVGSGSAWEKEL